MLKFVYDRKIDDFFVPNCYPIKDNFYDDISSYIKETGKELKPQESHLRLLQYAPKKESYIPSLTVFTVTNTF